MPSYHPDLPQGHDLSCSDWPWQGGHHSCLYEVPVLNWDCYGGHWGFLSNACVYCMHINCSWNFHQNIFTLTISFIVLNAAIEFVLIYRSHPVLGDTTQSFTFLLITFSGDLFLNLQHRILHLIPTFNCLKANFKDYISTFCKLQSKTRGERLNKTKNVCHKFCLDLMLQSYPGFSVFSKKIWKIVVAYVVTMKHVCTLYITAWSQ